MGTTITNALPDIPRIYTAICEWLACVTYLLVICRRVPWQRTVAVGAVGLLAMIGIQYFNGAMPISDQAIIIARNTPTHSYSLFPAPIPTFSITNCSGSCSLVRSAAAIAAPVGVTNSPSTFVICNFK